MGQSGVLHEGGGCKSGRQAVRDWEGGWVGKGLLCWVGGLAQARGKVDEAEQDVAALCFGEFLPSPIAMAGVFSDMTFLGVLCGRGGSMCAWFLELCTPCRSCSEL